MSCFCTSLQYQVLMLCYKKLLGWTPPIQGSKGAQWAAFIPPSNTRFWGCVQSAAYVQGPLQYRVLNTLWVLQNWIFNISQYSGFFNTGFSILVDLSNTVFWGCVQRAAYCFFLRCKGWMKFFLERLSSFCLVSIDCARSRYGAPCYA